MLVERARACVYFCFFVGHGWLGGRVGACAGMSARLHLHVCAHVLLTKLC